MTHYPTPKAVAGTYTVETHDHPHDLVDEYNRVVGAAAEHPEKKSTALSSELDLPRERIRTWVDSNGKPDAVRGLETAQANGWLNVDVAADTFRALNTLVAAVFSGGSIDRQYVPAFVPDERGVVVVRVRDALDQLGAGTTTRAEDDQHRATEVLPVSEAAVFGRVLSALGAPAGPKNADSEMRLPGYLDDAPTNVREEFVQVYLWNRGTRGNESDGLQVIEARPSTFFEDLANLVEDVAGGPVSAKEDCVNVSADAARQLRLGRGHMPASD